MGDNTQKVCRFALYEHRIKKLFKVSKGKGPQVEEKDGDTHPPQKVGGAEELLARRKATVKEDRPSLPLHDKLYQVKKMMEEKKKMVSKIKKIKMKKFI